jgi:ADP-ribosylglycohydrolase
MCIDSMVDESAWHERREEQALMTTLCVHSCRCYKCESYLYHRTIPKLYTSYAMLTMLKFNEPPIDHPLPSADPAGSLRDAAAAIHEEDEQQEDEGDDAVMETSAAMVDRAPTRSSSQLEAYSANSSAAPSRSTSSAAPSRSASELASTTMQSPIAGMTPMQIAHPLIQKILGVIYGNALGDAFGLSTEFLDSATVKKLYGETYDPTTGKGGIPFPGYKKSRHSARWDEGDWTDDTDQMILIMETILECYSGEHRHSTDPSVLDGRLFAAKLKNWVKNGFRELGDPCGMGLGALTHQVVTHPNFLKDPHAAAADVWLSGGKKAAANGGLMRTSITGVFEYYSLPAVIANTMNMCQVTHADPRCIASCVLTTTLISAILQGAPISTPEDTESLIAKCLSITLEQVPTLGEHKAVFLEYVGMKQLAEMKLDDPPAIGFTLKCLASALFGLRSTEGFVPTMTRLVREAGDADTNGAVCGALLGARLGYDGLPAAWLNAMPNKAWLDAKVVTLVKLMMDRFEAQKKSAPTAAASSSTPAAAAAAAK